MGEIHHSGDARLLRQENMRTRGLTRPRWRARAALIFGGILLGTLGGELVARVVGFEFRPHMRNRVYFAEPDPLLGWRNRAGLAGPYGGDEFLTWVTINADGQRGPSHPVARVAGKRRVAVLGDSQTWGDGVADDETFIALLDGGDTEMLSFATPGWGTDQQLLALDNQAARFAPDVVVLALFIGNDLNDNLNRGTFQYPKPYFTLEDGDRIVLRGVPVPYSRAMHALIELYRGLMRHSALLNAIAEASRKERGDDETAAREPQPSNTLNNSIYVAEPTAYDRDRFAITSRLLREVVRHVRAIGAEPVLLIIPELWQIEVFNDPRQRAALGEIGADFRRPQRVFAGVAREEGAKVIDALPALARATRHSQASGGPHTFYREWRHLNAHGHAVIAELLGARLGVTDRPTRAASAGAADGAPLPPPPAPSDRDADRIRSRS